jgi:hypothetical protein
MSDSPIKRLVAFTVTAGFIGGLWLAQHLLPPAPPITETRGYVRQQEACAIAHQAKGEMLARGLKHQAAQLAADDVCEPARKGRRVIYWIAGIIGGVLLLGLGVVKTVGRFGIG